MGAKKGFTLVELLSVIVILAVISLITVPIMMGALEESKKRQFVENVKSVIDSIDHYNGQYAMRATGEYQVKGNEIKYTGKRKVENDQVEFKGTFDGHGSVNLKSDGVTEIEIQNGKWCVYGTNQDYQVKDGNCDGITPSPTPSPTVTPTEKPTPTPTPTEEPMPTSTPKPPKPTEEPLPDNPTATKKPEATIDVTPPIAKIKVTSKTLHSITVEATCEDSESGIKLIEFSKDDGKTYVKNGKNRRYTFKNLDQNYYQLKARCTNKVGATTVSKQVSARVNIDVTIDYKVDQLGWQRSKVVTILYPERQSGFVYQYSLDYGRTWQTVAEDLIFQELEFTSSGYIVARILEDGNYVAATTFTVTQVDNTPPVLQIDSYHPLEPNSFGYYQEDVMVSLDFDECLSGIAGYQYAISKDGGKTFGKYSSLQKNGSFKFETEGSNMVAKIRAQDVAGNLSEVRFTKIIHLDKQNPKYEKVEILNVTNTGYDIKVTGVKDEQSGIDRVMFPTWVSKNEEEENTNWQNGIDMVGKKSTNGIWQYHVDTSHYQNQKGYYHTHVYIYDLAGNFVKIPLKPVHIKHN